MTAPVRGGILAVLEKPPVPAPSLSSLAARPGDRWWEVRVMHAVRAGLVDEVVRLLLMAERNA